MAIFFCYTDECGCYNQQMSPKFVLSHPFYVRTTLMLDAPSWRQINDTIIKNKIDFGFGKQEEIKWSNLWSAKKNGESEAFERMLGFVESSLQVIHSCENAQIILTHTDNRTNNFKTVRYPNRSFLKMHLQDHMQRVELELESDQNNLALFFMDSINIQQNNNLKEAYHDLYRDGDFVHYKHIKDCLGVAESNQSVGLQLVDFISGIFSSVLKSEVGKENYSQGRSLFYKFVYPKIRTVDGKMQGYGIIDVPKNESIRTDLGRKIAAFKANADS